MRVILCQIAECNTQDLLLFVSGLNTSRGDLLIFPENSLNEMFFATLSDFALNGLQPLLDFCKLRGVVILLGSIRVIPPKSRKKLGMVASRDGLGSSDVCIMIDFSGSISFKYQKRSQSLHYRVTGKDAGILPSPWNNVGVVLGDEINNKTFILETTQKCPPWQPMELLINPTTFIYKDPNAGKSHSGFSTILRQKTDLSAIRESKLRMAREVALKFNTGVIIVDKPVPEGCGCSLYVDPIRECYLREFGHGVLVADVVPMRMWASNALPFYSSPKQASHILYNAEKYHTQERNFMQAASSGVAITHFPSNYLSNTHLSFTTKSNDFGLSLSSLNITTTNETSQNLNVIADKVRQITTDHGFALPENSTHTLSNEITTTSLPKTGKGLSSILSPHRNPFNTFSAFVPDRKPPKPILGGTSHFTRLHIQFINVLPSLKNSVEATELGLIASFTSRPVNSQYTSNGILSQQASQMVAIRGDEQPLSENKLNSNFPRLFKMPVVLENNGDFTKTAKSNYGPITTGYDTSKASVSYYLSEGSHLHVHARLRRFRDYPSILSSAFPFLDVIKPPKLNLKSQPGASPGIRSVLRNNSLSPNRIDTHTGNNMQSSEANAFASWSLLPSRRIGSSGLALKASGKKPRTLIESASSRFVDALEDFSVGGSLWYSNSSTNESPSFVKHLRLDLQSIFALWGGCMAEVIPCIEDSNNPTSVTKSPNSDKVSHHIGLNSTHNGASDSPTKAIPVPLKIKKSLAVGNFHGPSHMGRLKIPFSKSAVEAKSLPQNHTHTSNCEAESSEGPNTMNNEKTTAVRMNGNLEVDNGDVESRTKTRIEINFQKDMAIRKNEKMRVCSSGSSDILSISSSQCSYLEREGIIDITLKNDVINLNEVSSTLYKDTQISVNKSLKLNDNYPILNVQSATQSLNNSTVLQPLSEPGNTSSQLAINRSSPQKLSYHRRIVVPPPLVRPSTCTYLPLQKKIGYDGKITPPSSFWGNESRRQKQLYRLLNRCDIGVVDNDIEQQVVLQNQSINNSIANHDDEGRKSKTNSGGDNIFDRQSVTSHHMKESVFSRRNKALSVVSMKESIIANFGNSLKANTSPQTSISKDINLSMADFFKLLPFKIFINNEINENACGEVTFHVSASSEFSKLPVESINVYIPKFTESEIVLSALSTSLSLKSLLPSIHFGFHRPRLHDILLAKIKSQSGTKTYQNSISSGPDEGSVSPRSQTDKFAPPLAPSVLLASGNQISFLSTDHSILLGSLEIFPDWNFAVSHAAPTFKSNSMSSTLVSNNCVSKTSQTPSISAVAICPAVPSIKAFIKYSPFSFLSNQSNSSLAAFAISDRIIVTHGIHIGTLISIPTSAVLASLLNGPQQLSSWGVCSTQDRSSEEAAKSADFGLSGFSGNSKQKSTAYKFNYSLSLAGENKNSEFVFNDNEDDIDQENDKIVDVSVERVKALATIMTLCLQDSIIVSDTVRSEEEKIAAAMHGRRATAKDLFASLVPFSSSVDFQSSVFATKYVNHVNKGLPFSCLWSDSFVECSSKDELKNMFPFITEGSSCKIWMSAVQVLKESLSRNKRLSIQHIDFLTPNKMIAIVEGCVMIICSLEEQSIDCAFPIGSFLSITRHSPSTSSNADNFDVINVGSTEERPTDVLYNPEFEVEEEHFPKSRLVTFEASTIQTHVDLNRQNKKEFSLPSSPNGIRKTVLLNDENTQSVTSMEVESVIAMKVIPQGIITRRFGGGGTETASAIKNQQVVLQGRGPLNEEAECSAERTVKNLQDEKALSGPVVFLVTTGGDLRVIPLDEPWALISMKLRLQNSEEDVKFKTNGNGTEEEEGVDDDTGKAGFKAYVLNGEIQSATISCGWSHAVILTTFRRGGVAVWLAEFFTKPSVKLLDFSSLPHEGWRLDSMVLDSPFLSSKTKDDEQNSENNLLDSEFDFLCYHEPWKLSNALYNDINQIETSRGNSRSLISFPSRHATSYYPASHLGDGGEDVKAHSDVAGSNVNTNFDAVSHFGRSSSLFSLNANSSHSPLKIFLHPSAKLLFKRIKASLEDDALIFKPQRDAAEKQLLEDRIFLSSLNKNDVAALNARANVVQRRKAEKLERIARSPVRFAMYANAHAHNAARTGIEDFRWAASTANPYKLSIGNGENEGFERQCRALSIRETNEAIAVALGAIGDARGEYRQFAGPWGEDANGAMEEDLRAVVRSWREREDMAQQRRKRLLSGGDGKSETRQSWILPKSKKSAGFHRNSSTFEARTIGAGGVFKDLVSRGVCGEATLMERLAGGKDTEGSIASSVARRAMSLRRGIDQVSEKSDWNGDCEFSEDDSSAAGSGCALELGGSQSSATRQDKREKNDEFDPEASCSCCGSNDDSGENDSDSVDESYRWREQTADQHLVHNDEAVIRRGMKRHEIGWMDGEEENTLKTFSQTFGCLKTQADNQENTSAVNVKYGSLQNKIKSTDKHRKKHGSSKKKKSYGHRSGYVSDTVSMTISKFISLAGTESIPMRPAKLRKLIDRANVRNASNRKNLLISDDELMDNNVQRKDIWRFESEEPSRRSNFPSSLKLHSNLKFDNNHDTIENSGIDPMECLVEDADLNVRVVGFEGDTGVKHLPKFEDVAQSALVRSLTAAEVKIADQQVGRQLINIAAQKKLLLRRLLKLQRAYTASLFLIQRDTASGHFHGAHHHKTLGVQSSGRCNFDMSRAVPKNQESVNHIPWRSDCNDCRMHQAKCCSRNSSPSVLLANPRALEIFRLAAVEGLIVHPLERLLRKRVEKRDGIAVSSPSGKQQQNLKIAVHQSGSQKRLFQFGGVIFQDETLPPLQHGEFNTLPPFGADGGRTIVSLVSVRPGVELGDGLSACIPPEIKFRALAAAQIQAINLKDLEDLFQREYARRVHLLQTSNFTSSSSDMTLPPNSKHSPLFLDSSKISIRNLYGPPEILLPASVVDKQLAAMRAFEMERKAIALSKQLNAFWINRQVCTALDGGKFGATGQSKINYRLQLETLASFESLIEDGTLKRHSLRGQDCISQRLLKNYTKENESENEDVAINDNRAFGRLNIRSRIKELLRDSNLNVMRLIQQLTRIEGGMLLQKYLTHAQFSKAESFGLQRIFGESKEEVRMAQIEEEAANIKVDEFEEFREVPLARKIAEQIITENEKVERANGSHKQMENTSSSSVVSTLLEARIFQDRDFIVKGRLMWVVLGPNGKATLLKLEKGRLKIAHVIDIDAGLDPHAVSSNSWMKCQAGGVFGHYAKIASASVGLSTDGCSISVMTGPNRAAIVHAAAPIALTGIQEIDIGPKHGFNDGNSLVANAVGTNGGVPNYLNSNPLLSKISAGNSTRFVPFSKLQTNEEIRGTLKNARLFDENS